MQHVRAIACFLTHQLISSPLHVMQAHETKRVGHRGLGKSEKIKIEGAEWQGTKTTFAEEEDQDAATKRSGGEASGSGSEEVDGRGKRSKQGKKRGKKGKGKQEVAEVGDEQVELEVNEKKKSKEERKADGKREKEKRKRVASSEDDTEEANLHGTS